MGSSPWGYKEADTNEQLSTHTHTRFLEVKCSLGLILSVGASWLIVSGQTSSISPGSSLEGVTTSTNPDFSRVLQCRDVPLSQIVSHLRKTSGHSILGPEGLVRPTDRCTRPPRIKATKCLW